MKEHIIILAIFAVTVPFILAQNKLGSSRLTPNELENEKSNNTTRGEDRS